MTGQWATVDEYLAGVSEDRRAALQELRAMIRAMAPGAEECISYRMPAFRLEGRVLLAYGAMGDHCALYPMSGTTVASLAEELKGYPTSKGAIRFQPERPLPEALVRRVLEQRIAENARVAESPGRGAGRRSGAAPKRGEEKFHDVDAYIAACPAEVRPRLEQLRQTIAEAAPGASEAIKYGMPTFVLNGNLLHFGAFRNHIGLYPVPRDNELFRQELSAYGGSGATMHLPLDQPLPLELIGRIVRFRVAARAARRSESGRSGKPPDQGG